MQGTVARQIVAFIRNLQVSLYAETLIAGNKRIELSQGYLRLPGSPCPGGYGPPEEVRAPKRPGDVELLQLTR